MSPRFLRPAGSHATDAADLLQPWPSDSSNDSSSDFSTDSSDELSDELSDDPSNELSDEFSKDPADAPPRLAEGVQASLFPASELEPGEKRPALPSARPLARLRTLLTAFDSRRRKVHRVASATPPASRDPLQRRTELWLDSFFEP